MGADDKLRAHYDPELRMWRSQARRLELEVQRLRNRVRELEKALARMREDYICPLCGMGTPPHLRT